MFRKKKVGVTVAHSFHGNVRTHPCLHGNFRLVLTELSEREMRVRKKESRREERKQK